MRAFATSRAEGEAKLGILPRVCSSLVACQKAEVPAEKKKYSTRESNPLLILGKDS